MLERNMLEKLIYIADVHGMNPYETANYVYITDTRMDDCEIVSHRIRLPKTVASLTEFLAAYKL